MDVRELCARIGLPEGVTRRVLEFEETFDFSTVLEELQGFRRYVKINDARLALETKLGEDPDGVKILACMLHASADLYEQFLAWGMGDGIFNATMACYSRFIRETEVITGTVSFDRFWWTTRQAGGHLFRIGTLEYEVKRLPGRGYISLHIPSDADLSPASVDASLKQAGEVLKRIDPALEYWEYRCHSWLLDPVLREMLPESSNILRFQQRFDYLTPGEVEEDHLQWLFCVRGDTPLKDLPDNTTLRRKVKAHLLSGGEIHAPLGRLVDFGSHILPNNEKLGFGFLRYPKTNPDDDTAVDYPLLNAMVDAFLEGGGDYFDTAYTYQNGLNEEVLRKALVERHPRDAYRVADKLPGYMVKRREDCREFLETSLRRCGLSYFDVYLLHGLNAENYVLAEQFDQFGFLEEVRREGKALRTGFSYHDSPELLDRILTEHPEVDCVQLQINYLDWNSPSIQARRCYEVAVKHNKPVIVMEPVKGGTLANPPEKAAVLLAELDGGRSYSSFALEFVSRLPHVEIVLSGMNTLEQLSDNQRPMPPVAPEQLARRLDVLEQAAEVIRARTAVGCTGCGYCLEGCPAGIAIPRLMALYNEYAASPGESWKMEYLYQNAVQGRGKASDCLTCGKCQRRCPQKLEIPEYLRKLVEVFEEES